MQIPCGKCLGCRLERSRQWAIRCVHEAQIQEENGKHNCFITLTYAPEYLPEDGGVHKRHFQLFMKKLRKAWPNDRIRYLHCGEYGEKFGRPHYHALLFGFNFPDRTEHTDKDGHPFWTSEDLTKTWGKGMCSIGELNFESAAYVCRYITKKLSEGITDESYNRWEEKYVQKTTGAIRQEEYITMSRSPGIGQKWFEKYKSDVYPSDYIILRGKKMRPPKYYDIELDKSDPDLYKLVKERRLSSIPEKTELETRTSNKAKEKQQKQFNTNCQKRSYENESKTNVCDL